MNSTRGIAPLLVLAILAALTGAAWVVKPSLFPGAAKRAQTSAVTTQKLADANDAREGAAAASVTAIGAANALAPDSPAKTFISREVPQALTYLGAPDPRKLIEAEARRAAVMEGRAVEAEKLYATAAGESAKLAKALAIAEAAKRASDADLALAAAAEHARTMQLIGAGVIVLFLIAGWAWASANGIHPDLIGKMAADMRAGVAPLAAMDRYLAPRFHARVQKAAKLATTLKDEIETKVKETVA